MSSAGQKKSLRGWYVISLRPLAQHAGVRKHAAGYGARTFALSTSELQALDARLQLPAVLACARIIVTSPAAARFAHVQHALPAGDGRVWMAIGAGTAAALRRRGIRRVQLPLHGADSEALLALDTLQGVDGQSIGLITAPGGRGLLESTLQARGAEVVTALVYQRLPLRPAAARLLALSALPQRTALLLSSAEALDNLCDAMDEEGRRKLLARCCVVSSQRLADKARSLGFGATVRATDARPAKLLAALADHAERDGFR